MKISWCCAMQEWIILKKIRLNMHYPKWINQYILSSKSHVANCPLLRYTISMVEFSYLGPDLQISSTRNMPIWYIILYVNIFWEMTEKAICTILSKSWKMIPYICYIIFYFQKCTCCAAIEQCERKYQKYAFYEYYNMGILWLLEEEKSSV